MTPQRKTPPERGFLNTRLTGAVVASIVTVSKQSRPAMTTPLYTKSIIGRKPIDFINALVFLRRLLGLLVAPYVLHKMALRLIGLCESGFDGFPQSVVTPVMGNVKARTVDYCQ